MGAGKLVAWGDDSARQISDAPTTTEDFKQIAQGGFKQSLAIRNNGSLELWGGVGVPEPVPALPKLAGKRFVEAALGLTHIVAIRDNGSIWTHGAFSNKTDPKPSSTITASAVAAAGGHWLAIDATNQTLFQWPPPAPGAVAPPTGRFIKVGARNDYSIALSDDHRLFAWGGKAFPASGVPPLRKGLTAPISGSINLDVRVFLQDWDYDGQGHYVINRNFPLRQAPDTAIVDRNDVIVDIAAGVVQKDSGGVPHILALHASGSVTGWGPGNGPETQPPPGVLFARIAAGLRYSLGIANDGSIRYWGTTGTGVSTTPPGNFASIGAGVLHAAAVAAA